MHVSWLRAGFGIEAAERDDLAAVLPTAATL